MLEGEIYDVSFLPLLYTHFSNASILIALVVVDKDVLFDKVEIPSSARITVMACLIIQRFLKM